MLTRYGRPPSDSIMHYLPLCVVPLRRQRASMYTRPISDCAMVGPAFLAPVYHLSMNPADDRSSPMLPIVSTHSSVTGWWFVRVAERPASPSRAAGTVSLVLAILVQAFKRAAQKALSCLMSMFASQPHYSLSLLLRFMFDEGVASSKERAMFGSYECCASGIHPADSSHTNSGSMMGVRLSVRFIEMTTGEHTRKPVIKERKRSGDARREMRRTSLKNL